MKRILIATLLLMLLLTSMTGIAFADNHNFWFEIAASGKTFDDHSYSKTDDEQKYYVTLSSMVSDLSTVVTNQKLYFNSRRNSARSTRVADAVIFENVSVYTLYKSGNESYYSSANVKEGDNMILVAERGTLPTTSPYYYDGLMYVSGRWAP